MKQVLHIIVNDNPIAAAIIEAQRKTNEAEVRVEDLRRDNPDYNSLVELIFKADSVEVW
ncbi:MAG: hypothetical protein JWM04_2181 [Verrucomicrobiales bacterium]|jgi:hypothetical protein|nr:hypothetical protein [Verrucomicrobiales bacterium]